MQAREDSTAACGRRAFRLRSDPLLLFAALRSCDDCSWNATVVLVFRTDILSRVATPAARSTRPTRGPTALCFLCQLHHIRARVAAAATASRCTSRCWSRHREQRSSPICRRAALLHDNVYKPRVLRLDVMRASQLLVDCKRVQYAHKQGKARESVERSAAVCP